MRAPKALLLGPITAILDRGRIIGLHAMFAGRSTALLAVNVLAGALELGNAQVRARFRAAIVDALGRHFHRVRVFADMRQLIAAAGEHAAPGEQRRSLH